MRLLATLAAMGVCAAVHAGGAPGVLARTEGAGAADPRTAIDSPAHSDYVLHCAGCHDMQATGSARGRVPNMYGTLGHYLKVEGGRAYLVQVPGVNNTGLDDRRIAAVVNFVIERFAGASRPADFVPYTAAEVAAYRADRPVDIAVTRRKLLAARQAAGLPPP